MAEIVVDNHALELLGQDFNKAKKALLGELANRGWRLMREEVPNVTGNLYAGTEPPEFDFAKMEAEIRSGARSGRTGSREAKVFGKDGKEKKTVTLRPSPAFNYALAVARGRPEISPKNGRALLIPIPTAPSGEGYLMVGTQIYIVRKSAAASKPNPYDERAGKRLEEESPSIANQVLKSFFGDFGKGPVRI